MVKISGKIEMLTAIPGSEAVKIAGKEYKANDRAAGFIKNFHVGDDVEAEIDKDGLIKFISRPKTRQFGKPTMKDIAMPAPMGSNREAEIRRLACLKMVIGAYPNMPRSDQFALVKELEKFTKEAV